MSFVVVIEIGLVLAAIGFLGASFVFLMWGVVGQRGKFRSRRLRISLSSLLLFAAALSSAISVHYFNLMPASMRIIRPDFHPPHERWSSILSIVAPMLVLSSVGLVTRALRKQRGTRKLLLLTSLCCFLFSLAVGAANYLLIYSIQVPAFDRYVAIEGRDWLTHIGDAAPDFSVTMLDGSEVNMSDFRGKVVLLNFFATWCGPCMIELPHLDELWKDWSGNDDFAMLVVGREEPQETVAKFQAEKGYAFPIAVDPDRSAFGKFAAAGIPRTYLVSRDGRILYQSMGYGETELYAREFARLRKIISSQLATPP